MPLLIRIKSNRYNLDNPHGRNGEVALGTGGKKGWSLLMTCCFPNKVVFKRSAMLLEICCSLICNTV